jgi:hypothetical protein
MSSNTQAQLKAIQRAEEMAAAQAYMIAKNKEAARVHLLRIQLILAKRPTNI